jgi:hypothetical protein
MLLLSTNERITSAKTQVPRIQRPRVYFGAQQGTDIASRQTCRPNQSHIRHLFVDFEPASGEVVSVHHLRLFTLQYQHTVTLQTLDKRAPRASPTCQPLH